MTQTIEQLTARIERLNYSLAQETALSDRLKAASRMPGTGNYVEWIETIRNSHDQAEQLQAKVAELEEENDTLRRIHKESIDILVKELSDKDYEYNQKTNRLIERHAEQLNRCDAEVKRLTGRKDGEVPNY